MLAPPPRALTRSRRRSSSSTALVDRARRDRSASSASSPASGSGRLLLSPSLVPALVVLGLLGRRAAGRARDIDAAAVYWVTALAGILPVDDPARP